MLDHPNAPAGVPEILRAAAAVAFDLDAEVEDVREAIGQIALNAGAYPSWHGLSASEIADEVLRLARSEGISKPITAFDKGREQGRRKVLVEALQGAGNGAEEDDASPRQERTPSKGRDQEPEL